MKDQLILLLLLWFLSGCTNNSSMYPWLLEKGLQQQLAEKIIAMNWEHIAVENMKNGSMKMASRTVHVNL